jgi:hypothetical protein
MASCFNNCGLFGGYGSRLADCLFITNYKYSLKILVMAKFYLQGSK